MLLQTFDGGHMSGSFFKHILRQLERQRFHTFLNVLGLAIGLASCLLIVTYVIDDFRWDKFNLNYDHIARMDEVETYEASGTQIRAVVPAPYAPVLQKQIPEIEAATRVLPWGQRSALRDNVEVAEGTLYFVDPEFLRIFTYPLVLGDPGKALDRTDGIVISDRLAKKVYGDDNPLGQPFQLSDEETQLTVTGVFRTPNVGSHLSFDMLRPILATSTLGVPLDLWQASFIGTYLLLTPDADPKAVADKILATLSEYRDVEHVKYRLEPLARLHLHSTHIQVQMNEGQGNVIYDVTLLTITFLILLIASVNYINLATARAMQRTREVALRKVVGANRLQLVAQFLVEAVMIALIAALFGLLFAELGQPLFERLTGRVAFLDLFSLPTLAVYGLAAVLIGLLSGLYPAILATTGIPAFALKSHSPSSRTPNSWMRRTLVGFQFTISIALMITTVLVLRQIHWMQNASLGFDPEQVITMNVPDELWKNEESMLSQLRAVPGVVAVSASWNAPGYGSRQSSVYPAETMKPWMVDLYSIDGYGEQTFKFELIKGRFISPERATDIPRDDKSIGAAVINETAAKEMGWDDPIGKKIWLLNHTVEIVGEIRDFHQYSLHSPYRSTVMVNFPEYRDYVSIRIKGEDRAATLHQLEKTWSSLSGGKAFNYHFLDERFAEMYRSEQRFANLMKTFSLLSVLLACFGLFGLTANAVEARTKEMGIRRVLGASPMEILSLLNREMVLLAIAGNVIAWPAAWWVIHRWLQNFAFRDSVAPWVFPLAGAVTLLIALGTVSLLALRAVRLNPADVLRDE